MTSWRVITGSRASCWVWNKLYDYDRYAPLPRPKVSTHGKQAREMVLAAYNHFHPRMGEIAGLFFSESWIDAPPVPGKRGVLTVRVRSRLHTRMCL